LVNTATVTASPEGFTNMLEASDSLTVDLVHPGLAMTKECDPGTGAVGDIITYTITITNTGDVNLENVTVMDSLLGDLSASFVDDLAVGASDTQQFTRAIEAGDANPLVNTATVNATVIVLGNPVTATDSCDVIVISIENNPAISINKLVANITRPSVPADLASLMVGETARYSVVITNTGNTQLLNVVFTDDQAIVGSQVMNVTDNATLTWVAGSGGIASVNLGSLEVGESIALTYDYLTVIGDLANEVIINIAAVTGDMAPTPDHPLGATVSDSDDAAITVEELPLVSIGIIKQVKNLTQNGILSEFAAGQVTQQGVGDVFLYQVTVSNNSAVMMTDVILTDDRAAVGSAIRNVTTAEDMTWSAGVGGIATVNIGTLAAGQSMTFTYTYNSDADDIDIVRINTATLQGTVTIGDFDPQVLTVQDEAAIVVDQIPVTGENGSPILMGLALLLGAAVLVVLRKRSNWLKRFGRTR
jgi:uncharacterized repeat protein (TIGR01451 family)/LPXTG-motif cell wall-anchored protein